MSISSLETIALVFLSLFVIFLLQKLRLSELKKMELEVEFKGLTEKNASQEDELQRRQEALQELQKENAQFLSELSGLKVRLEEERKNFSEKISFLGKAQEELKTTFKAASSDVLQENQKTFFGL